MKFLKKFMFKISTGRMFDPYYQKRTSAKHDILKKSMEKTDRQLDKMFGIKKEDHDVNKY